MKTRQYLYIMDPGHGWLAVPSTTIRKLGLAQDISPYSYVSDSGKTVYCEEDCDAALVVEALRARGIELRARKVNNAHNYSSIRAMRHYTPGAIGVVIITEAPRSAISEAIAAHSPF
jgi:hypothetical protein